MSDTSRENIERSISTLRCRGGAVNNDIAAEMFTLINERDAAIAGAEKAEAALEAARIEGCRMGFDAVTYEAKNWEFVGEDFVRGVAWVINELDPAQIVKEHGK